MHFSSIFHPIGQGCFYLGGLWTNSNNFQFVYDCGSNSSPKNLSAVVQRAAMNIDHSGRLNLLIISHFDADHVNGVKELLEHTHGCDTVILPYLTPMERLELFAASAESDPDNNDPDGDDDDAAAAERFTNAWIDFLRNPVAFLQNNKVERIIFIHGDGSEGEGNNADAPRTPEPSRQEGEINDQGPMELVNRLQRVQSPQDDSSAGGSGNVLHCSHHGYVAVNAFWYFRFYNEKKEEEDVNAFHEAIKKMLREMTHNHPAVSSSDFSVLFAKEKRDELAKLYKSKFGAINDTSLAVFHAPIRRGPHCSVEYRVDFNSSYRTHYSEYYEHEEIFGGTLLTGDINIKPQNKLDKFIHHFKDELEHVFLFQIPHHGAVHNWNGLIVSSLPNTKHYVINAGNDRKLHPHPIVLKDLFSLVHSGIILNSEKAKVRIDLDFFEL